MHCAFYVVCPYEQSSAWLTAASKYLVECKAGDVRAGVMALGCITCMYVCIHISISLWKDWDEISRIYIYIYIYIYTYT
jgi:hypothetical protein